MSSVQGNAEDNKGFYPSSSGSESTSPSPRRHSPRSRTSRSRSRSRSHSSDSRSRSRTRSRSKSPKRRSSYNHRRDEYRYARSGRDDNSRQRDSRLLRGREDSSPSDHSQDSSRSDKSSQGSRSAMTTAAAGGDGGAYDGNLTSRADGENIPKAPPPPRISRQAIQFGKPGTVARPGIHMKLGSVKPKPEPTKKITVASAFNNDSDEEVEEMPPECKMRMRNIGRDTPTSSGPNSFGKTKQGFIDSKKLFEKSLREAAME